MRMPRTPLAVAGVTAVSLLVASCSFLPSGASHPTGTHGLEQTATEYPELGSVGFYDTSGDDWSGSGPVYAYIDADAMSASRLETVVDALGGFLAADRGGDVAWESITLQFDAIALDVRDRRDENDEARAAFATISADPGVSGARVGRYTWVTTDRDHVAAEMAALGRSLADDGFVGSRTFEVDSDDDAESIALVAPDPGDPPVDAIRAYEQLAEHYDIDTLYLTASEIDITVPVDQVARAQQAADRLQDAAGATILVSGGSSSAQSG